MRDPTTLTLDDWIADLEVGEAQVAAGQGVPLEPIVKRLRDHADGLEMKAVVRRGGRRPTAHR